MNKFAQIIKQPSAGGLLKLFIGQAAGRQVNAEAGQFVCAAGSNFAAVQVGKTSGLAGIAYWINQNYRLNGEEAVSKQDPLVRYLKDWVDAEYEAGRQTVISTHELEEKIRSYHTASRADLF